MADIVICYAHENGGLAEQFEKAFRAHGWSVWWDRLMLAGEGLDGTVREKIAQARCVVVIWSKEAVASGWVEGEALFGFELGKLVLTRLDDAELPLRLRNLYAPLLDIRNVAASPAFESVLGAIRRLLSGEWSLDTSLKYDRVPRSVDENLCSSILALIEEDSKSKKEEFLKRQEIPVFDFRQGWSCLFDSCFYADAGVLRDFTLTRFGDTSFQKYDFKRYANMVTSYIDNCEERSRSYDVRIMVLCEPSLNGGENNRQAALFIEHFLNMKYVNSVSTVDRLNRWTACEPGERSKLDIMVTKSSIVKDVNAGDADFSLPFNVYGDVVMSRSVVGVNEGARVRPVPHLRIIMERTAIEMYSRFFDLVWLASLNFKHDALRALKKAEKDNFVNGIALDKWSSDAVRL